MKDLISHKEPEIILDEMCGTIMIHGGIPAEDFAAWFVANFSMEYLRYLSTSLIDEIYFRYRDYFDDEAVLGKQALAWTQAAQRAAIMLAIQHLPDESDQDIAETVGCSPTNVQECHPSIETNGPVGKS